VEPIRLLIVEDDAAFADALVSMLERDARVDVVGTARNGVEAIDAVRTMRPDAVTMDLDMPLLGGVEATRAIGREHPAVAVVVLTASTSSEGVDRALEAGAVAQVAKNDAWALLLPTLLAAVGPDAAAA
jgi:DNA-binding NarL/FixJ family response regulator